MPYKIFVYNAFHPMQSCKLINNLYKYKDYFNTVKFQL